MIARIRSRLRRILGREDPPPVVTSDWGSIFGATEPGDGVVVPLTGWVEVADYREDGTATETG